MLSDNLLKCVGEIGVMLRRKSIASNTYGGWERKSSSQRPSNNLEKAEKEDQLKFNAMNLESNNQQRNNKANLS